ncbi:MAG: TIGR01777 family oxidoreductase [Verrucomicrobiaceae bacterium]
MAKTIGIIGASGWLGRHLVPVLLEKGMEVVGYSRSAREDDEVRWRRWDGRGEINLSEVDVVVNLAGESIDQRWTEERKRLFYESRVSLTQNLVKAMEEQGCGHLVNASAVGYYGDRGNELLPESEPAAENYLARLCEEWEEAAAGPEKVCLLRTGVVLGKGGGAWEKMSKIFGLGVGGKLGSGAQWFPWIHLADEIGSIVFCIENGIEGPVNLVAPESVTNGEFTKVVGRVMKRPTFFAAPAFALKLALGDFAEEGLLASQRVVPQVLVDGGYEFRYRDIESAVRELCD